MAYANKVILIGRLGNQPELKYTSSSRAVTELRLAVSRTWTDRTTNQRQEKTDWFSVEVWDKQAEHCERYLAKGREVYVEGRLSTDEWTDKEGQKRTKTKVVAENVQFIGAKPEGAGDSASRPAGGDRGFEGGGGGGPRGPARQPAPGMADAGDFGPTDDDIPF